MGHDMRPAHPLRVRAKGTTVSLSSEGLQRKNRAEDHVLLSSEGPLLNGRDARISQFSIPMSLLSSPTTNKVTSCKEGFVRLFSAFYSAKNCTNNNTYN